MKTKVGIIGSTGYTGIVLCKLLLNHPEIEIKYITSEQHSGKYFYEIHPAFYDSFKLKCELLDLNRASTCDVVFFATPHDFAIKHIPKLIELNSKVKVIDLSTDFRLTKKIKVKNDEVNIAYGLPELYREKIKSSQIVANPGCYPTSVILALAPLLKKKIIKTESMIIDSKSGISGAGRQAKQELQFCELNESFAPYSLGGKHRHVPEIEHYLSDAANQEVKVVFSPHLIPMSRGILSTIYAELNTANNIHEIREIFLGFYKNEHFIKVLPDSIYPNTKNVRYTNTCQLLPLIDERTKKLIIVSAIDNMVKGASGQAIQNLNIMQGYKENLGLDSIGQIP